MADGVNERWSACRRSSPKYKNKGTHAISKGVTRILTNCTAGTLSLKATATAMQMTEVVLHNATQIHNTMNSLKLS